MRSSFSIGSVRLHDKDVTFYLKCFLALFPFFEPRLFINYSPLKIIDKAYLGMQIAMFMIIGMVYVLKQHYSFGIFWLIMYRLSVLICTLLSAGRVDTGWFGKTIIFIGTAMVLEIFIKRDALKTLICLYSIMLIPIFINLFMCILGISVSSGGTSYYFIGMRTQFPNTMIPAIGLAMIISYIKHKTLISLSVVLTTFVCIVQLVIEWVGTGIVLIALLIILFVFFSRKPSWFHVPLLFLSTIILNIGISILRIQNIFAFIIVDMMHKDLTISGRTSIWDVVVKKITESLLIGHGELGSGGIVRVHWATRPVPAHNSMLQIIYDGGLISMTILMIFILYSCMKLHRHRGSKISCIIGIGIVLVGVQMITEILQYQVYFYLFPILAYNIKFLLAYDPCGKDNRNRLVSMITNATRY